GGKPSPAQRRALEDTGVVRGLPVGLWPPSGPAPLEVGLVWIAREERAQTVEMDADGDGVPEVVGTQDEAFGHTSEKPGPYAPPRWRGRGPAPPGGRPPPPPPRLPAPGPRPSGGP